MIEASSAKPPAALDEHYPNVEKKGAQSWERPADFYPAGQTQADELAETLERIRNASEGWGPALGMNADPGDKFSFTIGQETFAPIPYHTFVVGPFSAQVTLRRGEDLAEMAKRAYRFLATVFEAEFMIKKKHFWERVAEAGENPVKNKGGKS